MVGSCRRGSKWVGGVNPKALAVTRHGDVARKTVLGLENGVAGLENGLLEVEKRV